jgi:hypothetical protein
MQARKWIIGALAATFFASSVVVPDRAEAGPADGLFGLAAGVIIGSAMSQQRPVYYRTYRPRRVSYRAPAARKVYVSRPKARPTARIATDPFASQATRVSTH